MAGCCKPSYHILFGGTNSAANIKTLKPIRGFRVSFKRKYQGTKLHQFLGLSSSPIQTVTVGSGLTPDPPLYLDKAGHGLGALNILLTVGRELHPAPKMLNRYVILNVLYNKILHLKREMFQFPKPILKKINPTLQMLQS